MKPIRILCVMSLAACMLLLGACDQPETVVEESASTEKPVVTAAVAPETGQQGGVMATILEFEEVEADVEPYITRMTVSDRYIRIDDSAEVDGFVLYDRTKKRIFSVVHGNQSILVVDPVKPLEATPADLEIKSVLVKDDQAPSIGGIKPDYYQIFANEQLCYHLVAVDGFLPDVSTALQSYQMVLAAQQQASLINTPEELQTPCFLANYIYAPAEYGSKGFPVQQWDASGYRRSLAGIEENVSVDGTLFELPADYAYFSIGGGNLRM